MTHNYYQARNVNGWYNFACTFRGMHIIYSYRHIHVHGALTIYTSKHLSDPTRINHTLSYMTWQICIHLSINTMKV